MADNAAQNASPVASQVTTNVTTSENAAPMNYAGALNGTEQVAKEIVDANNSNTSQQAALDVSGKAAPFAGMDILDPAGSLNNIGTSSGMPMKAPANAAGSALNSGTALDTSVAAVNLTEPQAGQTEIVSVQPGQNVFTSFDPNSADLKMQGDDLVLSFNNGGKIVLDHFAADTQNMPNIVLPNGSLVAGGIIIAQLQGTNDDIFNLQTAAGAGAADASSGQANYSDDFGTVIGLLNKLPGLPFTALSFGQPQPQVVQAALVPDDVGGTFTTTVTTVITPPPGNPGTPGNPNPALGGVIGPVSGGFEDWQPYQHIGSNFEIPAALQITFTPSDNEVVDTVTISNFPAGTQFFIGTAGNFTLLPITNGTVSFTGADLAANNIFIKPPLNIDKDIPFTVTLDIRDPDNGLTAVVSQNTVAVIDAVADLPTLTSSVSIAGVTAPAGVITGADHSQVTFNVNVAYTDNDGSETHTIVLDGVPASWTPAGGTLVIGGVTFVATNNGDGTITYTATVTSSSLSGTVTFNTNNYEGTATMNLTARASENVTDGELTTANNTAQLSTPFKVTITDDVPTIETPTPNEPGSAQNPVVILENTLLVPGVDQVSNIIEVNFHADNPGTIKLSTDGLAALNLTSHGQTLTYAISADGKTITATDTTGDTVFTVTLGTPTTNGTVQTMPYTFTLLQPLDHPTGNGANIIDIPVKFTGTDSDGDSISGNVHIDVVDGLPSASAFEATTDETNQLGQIINGNVTVNFGADGAGTIAASETFTSTGSKLGGNLTSNGVAVNVTFENGQYVGKAGGTTVFTMKINADGSYSFTQFKVLDHANGSNPNDVIDLNFGYKATDYDGDSVSSNITVHVRDDAPVAVNDTNFIPNGSTVATGNILNNDVLSKDAPTLVQGATVNGTSKSFAAPDGTDAGGKYVLLTGTYGQLKLYENGAYTYTYDTAKHNGNFTERFDYTIVDFDRDTSSTQNNSGLVITITDNGPGNAPSVEATVDETTLGTAASGTIVPANPLHDYALSSTGFASSGSQTGGNLTSHGVPVTVTLVNGQYVGTANGNTVFTLTLNANGSYTFVQNAVIDHANGANPNDVIDLKFNYSAKDANNETVPGTITVHVRDDAPVAVNDSNFIPNGSTVATGNILANDTMSKDAPTLVQGASVNGTTKTFGTPDGTDAGGKYILLTGTYGQLKLYENGAYTYTYDTAKHNGNLTERFDYTIIDYDTDTSSTQNNSGLVITITDNGPGAAPNVEATVDETTLGTAAGGTIVPANPLHDYALASTGFGSSGSQTGGNLTSHGVPVIVTLVNGQYVGTANGNTVFTLTLNANGTYNFVQSAVIDHADGANPNDVIDLKFNYTAKDANNESVPGTITVHVRDDAPTAIADSNTVQSGGNVASGNVIANDILSKDTPNVLKNVSFANTTVSFDNPTGTDGNGKFIVLNGVFGNMKIYQNGDYTYTYNNAQFTGNHTEKFSYTLVDYDGDSSTTDGSKPGEGITITIIDGAPTASPTFVGVDETDTLGQTFSGSFNSTFGPEGPGAVAANGDFNATGSKLDGNLTSHGVPVTVTLSGNTYTGVANGVEVFKLTVNANGTYNFVQYKILDHADGANINDAIDLNFGYKVTDKDGDTATSVITVRVLDDAPIAIADTNMLNNGQTVATGNVIANDTQSHDMPNVLKSVSFANQTVSFDNPTGTDAKGKFVDLTGKYGTIHIYQNGDYTYTYDAANHSGTNVEQFGYTIIDYDKDTSTTSGTVSGQGLTITIIDNGPGQAPTIVKEVDETHLNTTITGTVSAPDANSYTLTNGFTSGGSQTGGQLTSNGQLVTVTLNGNQYVGTVGGTIIFVLTLNNDGSYNFVQKGVLDHADGNNPNDSISLNFSYLAKDNDGDSSLGHIIVNVLDDAPLAVADINNIPNGGTTVGGNVISNDDLSNDVPNTIQSLTFNGVTKSFTTPDGTDGNGKYVIVNGAYGQIQMYENGNYTYKYTDTSHTGNHTEQFNYTLKDSDGDHSSTTLTINIEDNFNAPPTLNIVGSSNNDNLFSIGKLTVPFGGMPELIELNNINCTPAQFATLTQNASNMMNLNFPTVLTINIDHARQQDNGDFGSFVKSNSNGMGAFMLDAGGNISNVQLLYGNVNNTSTGQTTYDTSGGSGKVVFFILTDAFNALKAAGLSDNSGNALHPDNVHFSMQKQADGSLKLVYTDAAGTNHVLNAPLYTSDPSFNADGQAHAVAGTYGDTPAGSAVYAFEDDYGPYSYPGSDRDFNDVVFSVSAQPLVTAHYSNEHQLFDAISITDSDSVKMSEALVVIRNPHGGDMLSFNFGGTSYSMNGDHVMKNGVDTGITASFTNTAGGVELHLIGESATGNYTDILKALHFNAGGDVLSSNGIRTIDVTVTDDHHQSSTLTTTYNVNLQVDSSYPTAPVGGGTLNGTSNDDVLIGREGNDTLNGGAGHDTLIGGSGSNTLTGGAGADSFMFLHGTTGTSTITDYHKSEGDRIDIRDLLTGSNYTPGVSHVENYVKIDHTTGNVYVDNTGTGHFNNANHVATIGNISSVETVNVLLNDHEGNKVVHTV